MDQLEYAALLSDHARVVTLVRPSACHGLTDFADRDVLRLDVGHAASPPMYPVAYPAVLTLRASFQGVSRAVLIPRSAVMWAGSEEDYARAQRRSEGASASAAPPALRAVPSRPRRKSADIIYVDFRRRCVTHRVKGKWA